MIVYFSFNKLGDFIQLIRNKFMKCKDCILLSVLSNY